MDRYLHYIEQRLKELTEELDPSGTIDVEMSKARGRASDCIRQEVRHWQADLIVLGMKHMHHCNHLTRLQL